MSNSVRTHRRQLTRLLCPWDSPGKNTGVGCHFLLQCMKVKSENEVPQSCLTLSDPMDCSLPGSSVHGISCFKIVMITFRIMSKSLRRRFSVIYPLSASPIESLLAFLLILSSHICRLVLWEGTCWLVLPYLGMAQMPSVLLHSCLQMCPSSSVTSSASLP